MRGVGAIVFAALFGLAVPAQATDLPVKAPAPPPEPVALPAEAPIFDPLLIGGVAGAAALLLLIHEDHGSSGTCPGVNCGAPPVSPF